MTKYEPTFIISTAISHLLADTAPFVTFMLERIRGAVVPIWSPR
jgi:hypothetical protein